MRIGQSVKDFYESSINGTLFGIKRLLNENAPQLLPRLASYDHEIRLHFYSAGRAAHKR